MPAGLARQKKAGKSRFHIPKNVYRINERRCIRRKEYRAHMRSRVSELRKKEEAKWLRKNPTKVAREMHKDKKWSKKTQIRVMRLAKARKKEWRKEWTKHCKQVRGMKSKELKTRIEPETRKQGKGGKARGKGKHAEESRISMHKKIMLTLCNERNINAIAKRQQLAQQWEAEKIDVALMSETNKNTGGMEDGSSWGNEYIVFFSSGIKLKTREEQEKKILKNWEAAQRKTRKKKGKPNPTPIAMAQPTALRREKARARNDAKARELGKGKGKGKGPSRRDADFEHAGVGIAIRKKWLNNIKEVKEISGRIMVVTLTAVGGDLHFVSVYAPPADHKLQKKEAFYDELSRTLGALHGIVYVGGDFNARIFERMEYEKEVIGKHILPREGYVTTQEKGKGIGDNTRENRDLFVGFLKAEEMTAINTQFTKPPEKLVTYKEKVPEHNPDSELYQGENTGPYDHRKYAQCDYLLVKKGFQKTVADCETRVDLSRDTDHIPMVAEIRTNMKKQQKAHGEAPAKKYYKPSEERYKEYNEAVSDSLATKKGWIQESDQAAAPATLEDWVEVLQAAAEGTLEKIDPEIKKDYISKETWEKIKKRNDLQKSGDPDKEVSKLSREIKKEAYNSRKQKNWRNLTKTPKIRIQNIFGRLLKTSDQSTRQSTYK